ncbi:MAG: exopolysaccharide biosynthesis protein [Verrucomicrobiales bacterium]|nr:exopolysaccharide biosynthesis protein [Verrucomicrobiales bacterium]
MTSNPSSQPGDPPPAPARVIKRTLSSQLGRLAAQFSGRQVQLGEVIDVLQLRGYNAMLILLAFPFITPIPLPGFSTVFGLIIASLGLRMLLAQRPWIPRRLMTRELPSKILPKLLLAASRGFGRLEKLLRPRLLYPDYPVAFKSASGAIVLACGLLLLLPLPVPFSNAFPALTIILIAAAGLEHDGLVFLAGCVQFAFCLGFFAALCWGGSEAWFHLFS